MHLQNQSYVIRIVLAIFMLCKLHMPVISQTESPHVYPDQEGILQYHTDTRGNRIPDYSYCGYDAGESDIPSLETRIFVPWQKDDVSHVLQELIDYVGGLELDSRGFRGVIELDSGIFTLSGRLLVSSSGIVIRGSGMGEKATVLMAAGTDRETLIRVAGENNKKTQNKSYPIKSYVPVNSMQLPIDDPSNFRIGDTIRIKRPVSESWIDTLQMHEFGGETAWLGWKKERNSITWHRVITGIEDRSVLIDAPITTAIDPEFGGGSITKISWSGLISHVGIENMALKSAYNLENPRDEDHCWNAISFENASNSWVRQVSFSGFAGSAVAAYETARKITIEDCVSQHPVSEIAGHRRHTFFTSGEQILFQRCYSESGYHDFATGNFAAGPNAFVQCESHLPFNFSGTIDRWAGGVLFDLVRIDGNALSLKNRESSGQGAGWTAGNSMIWQSSASKIECYSPPTSINYAYGTWGSFSGNGHWYESNSFIKPRSLYYAQLQERIGLKALKRARFVPIELGSTTTPTVELAAELTDNSLRTHVLMKDWIFLASEMNPIPLRSTQAKIIEAGSVEEEFDREPLTMKLKNGWLLAGGEVITGETIGVRWWRGNTRAHQEASAGPHITRYVPGRRGSGLTDILVETAELMESRHIAAINHNYGLWYDRRRDDHEMIRRLDADCWAPFYELPFARSGKGSAWDGLSKFDLETPNVWYWKRLRDFAMQADQRGLVLIHQNYFQHNILEAGAHFADFPWRPANNINHTGFPEPPPYAGNKRIYMAEQFYDTSNVKLAELHRQYIRQCLHNFRENTNVIHHISEEYTGPLHFVEFWASVIMEWEQKTGYKPFIGLSTTKDVQDSVLRNANFSSLFDVIDIKYWQYRADGTVYAPLGGLSLAPRQHARLVEPGEISFESVYSSVSEYRLKYPDKAITYSNRLHPPLQWAVFMGGGSLAAIPVLEDPQFLEAAAGMLPVIGSEKGYYCLMNKEGEQIIYFDGKKQTEIDTEKLNGTFGIQWTSPESGLIIKSEKPRKPENPYLLTPPVEGAVVARIYKL